MSEIENAPKPDQNTVAQTGESPTPAIGKLRAQRRVPLHETDWWKGVIANTNRMAVDEEFRKLIAKDLS